MRLIIPVLATTLACGFAWQVDPCHAQFRQTVQLPTFHVTGVATTVIVPDRGSVYLGGVNRSSLGQRRFGTPLLGPTNRSFSRSSAAGGISIHATIIDHDEIDRALLAEAARRRGAKFDVRGRPVADAPRLRRDVVGQRWAAGLSKRGATTTAPPPY
ncbi:MAG: hypothetical protein ACR2NM_16275 [Bythopirellula sp.]